MKKAFALLLSLFTLTTLFAQPANDDCAGIIDLGEAPICPVLDTFNNVGATESVVFSSPLDNLPSCFTGGTVDRDVWFQFTVPADGSVVDFTVELTGIVGGPNGTIEQPQIAVYRGECSLDELAELYCSTSALNETSVEVDLIGMTPGLPIFLRISDWSASASPESGDFVLCVKEYEPVFNIGDEPGTAACAGTLYDSGGPTGDYQNSENESFTVCPQDFTQCIFVNVQTFATEFDFDFINIFIGDDTNDPMLTSVNGIGGNVQLQVYGQCVTFEFISDNIFTDAGFELTWQCSPDLCTVPPPSTCDNPTVIPSLPFANPDMTTCNAASDVNASPCNNDGWLGGEDVVFSYTSPGDECIAVNLTGTNNATGVGIFDGCGSSATECIAVAGGGFGEANPSINAAFLENAGTYYIVVDNATSCTPFNIEVTQVTCPVVLPSAGFCEDALSLNGCGELPAVVSVAPGLGDPDFLVEGVNDGCWGGFDPPNFTFFLFQAQEDGNFGFVMEASNPAESSDIDFQVWGPIASLEEVCGFAETNQPARSSYAAGDVPTGLADFHPDDNSAVTDVCEDAGGDNFVSTIPVLQGEYYLVLINDFDDVITSGAISIDFGNTTEGVLDEGTLNFAVTQDTAVCPGEAAQLLATGGESYQWFPATGLSCQYCPNPIASVSQSTVYSVAINSVCNADTLEVEVGFLQVDAGPDLSVCLNEDIQIVAGASFASVDYQWTGQTGILSCTDCPNPIVTATQAGTFTFTVTVTGPTCAFSDAMTLTVLPSGAPNFQISPDLSICNGETVSLGGPATPGVNYVWTSAPVGFTSASANPSDTPTATTTYYLQATNTACPLPSLDSVLVTVSELPIINVTSNTSICQGQSLVLGSTVPEPGVVYAWSPATGLDDASLPNPTATPTQTTTYTFTANRFGCESEASVMVSVTPIEVNILTADTIPICKGVSVPISATATPTSTIITWTPNNGTLNTTTGPNVIATPFTATSYIASATNLGCTRFDTIYIGVDSLPWDMGILPSDTVICLGEQVLLTSPVYEPGDFGQIEFAWTGDGQLTPDSFYNMVVQPTETTTYYRMATNGFCSGLDSSTVTVISVTSLEITPLNPVICAGDTVQLTATSPVELEYTWEPADGLSCTDCPNPLASPSVTTPYIVMGEYDGCPIGGSVTVTVVAQPTINPPMDAICQGDAVGLNEGGNGAWGYEWSSPDDPTFGSMLANPSVSPSQTTSYEVVVDNGVCPAQSFQVEVQVSDNPTLSVSADTIVCGASSVQLFAQASEIGGTYTWSDGSTGPNQTLDLVLGANSFTVVFTNTCGDILTETILVELVDGVDVDILNEPDTLYQGTGVVLMAEASIPATYQWSSGSTSDTANVVVLTLPSETYYVTATDDLGCTDVDSITFVVLESKFDIPNAFSPNGDDVNDAFKVVILGENIIVESMSIWNRWGQMVFEEKNSNEGWDGRQGEKESASDVYIYKAVITLPDGSKYVESGDLTLLR